MTRHSEHGNCDVRQPSDDEHGDVDGNDFGDLDLLLLLVGVVGRHPADLFAVLCHCPHNAHVTEDDETHRRGELENDEANVEGNVVDGSCEVVPSAREAEAFRHEGSPSEPRWQHPADGVHPDENDLLQGTHLCGRLHHV